MFLKIIIICVIFFKNAGTVNSQFPLPEPNDLKVASQVTFEDMEDAIGSLRRQLESCERKLSKVMNGTTEDLKQPFVDVMYSFLEQSRRELSEQDQALEDCKKRYLLLKFGFILVLKLSSTLTIWYAFSGYWFWLFKLFCLRNVKVHAECNLA